jgi:chromate transport protein ChrA
MIYVAPFFSWNDGTDGLPYWMSGLAPAATSLIVIAAYRLWEKACGTDTLKGIIAAISSCVVLATQGMSSLVFPILMGLGGTVTLLSHQFGVWKSTISMERIKTHNLEK